MRERVSFLQAVLEFVSYKLGVSRATTIKRVRQVMKKREVCIQMYIHRCAYTHTKVYGLLWHIKCMNTNEAKLSIVSCTYHRRRPWPSHCRS